LTILGKTCDGVSPSLADQIRSRLQNFLGRAQSAELNYYLAMCWWRTNQSESKADRVAHAESLLNRALTIDPNYDDAHFQLGALYAAQEKYADAKKEYELALKINPNSPNTHYHLAQSLAKLGDRAHAQEEFAIFERLRKSESEATNKELNQIQQFVYQMRKSDAN
jgi:Tfp pilus assembly protein PilF